MRARLLAFAFPLVLVACKKKEPAPPAPGSAVAAAASAPAPSLPAAGGADLAILRDFEGQISWAVKGKLAGPAKPGAAPLTLALLVKGGKFRLDIPPGLAGAPGAGSGYLLGHPQEKKFYAVLDAQKQAVLIELEKVGSQLEAMGGKSAGPGAAEDAPDVKKTGKLDKVAGYGCEVWKITHKTSNMEMCIAAEGTAWFSFPVAKMPAKYAWASELTDGKHFPLRVVMFDKSGAEEGRIELASIEKKSLSAPAFEVPAGYQVINLEQMMAGLMQGFTGMHGRAGMPNLAGLPQGLPSSLVRPKASPATPSASAKKKR